MSNAEDDEVIDSTDNESEYNDDDDDDETYESEEDDGSGRTLLFLCEEGQLDIALKRVKQWDEQFPISETTTLSPRNETAFIQRELFRKNPNTGNYCLHEILAGGTSGTSAPELVERLVRRYRSIMPTTTHSYWDIFMAQPTVGSNGRTILHWCAWSKTTPKILRMVLGACPEAMCLRDNKSHFSRTPLEIAERYWPEDEITKILKSSLTTYLPYRLRICVQLCAERLFLLPSHNSVNGSGKLRLGLKPFDKKDRKIAQLAPCPWFVASVLGYSMQREMKGLVQHILSFVGCGAKLTPKKSKKKKKRKNTTNAEESKGRKKRKTR